MVATKLPPVPSAGSRLIDWHQGIIESLQSRQLWVAVATIVGLLLQYFTGMHVSQTVLLGWILSGVSLIAGSSIAQAGHAAALGQATGTAASDPLVARLSATVDDVGESLAKLAAARAGVTVASSAAPSTPASPPPSSSSP